MSNVTKDGKKETDLWSSRFLFYLEKVSEVFRPPQKGKLLLFFESKWWEL